MAKQSKLGDDPLAARKGLSWLVPKQSEEAPQPPQEAPPNVSAGHKGRRSRQASYEGLSDGYKRHTFIVHEDLVRRVKEIAFYEDRPVKDVIEEALHLYLSSNRR